MTRINKKLAKILHTSLLTLLVAAFPLTSQAEAPAEEPAGRAIAVQIVAVVTDIDLETRQISLEVPNGEIITLTARENVVKLEDISVGDTLVTTYLAGLEAELREPTAEELAEPWLVIEDGAVSAEGEQPAIGGARIIRAVCTIEGMNRELGTVTIKDSRGKLHVIGDVEPEKMEGVALGQTVVIVYTEALALSLEKHVAIPE